MRIFVTGGAGYIGSHVVKWLGEKGHQIVVFDNLSTGSESAVIYGDLVKGDLADRTTLSKALNDFRPEAVFHFAASVIVPESVENPVKYYKNNTVNTLQLSELCLNAGVKNFIFSSTAAVYGCPESGMVTEHSSVNPITPYGSSKMMAERIIEDVARNKMNYAILRYFNVAGADVSGRLGQTSQNATHLIQVACETALGLREKLDVFGSDYGTGDGTCIRDYIHVDDLALAHIKALEYLAKKQGSLIVNCGYGQGYSVAEVVNVVKHVSGVDFKVHVAPRRPGDMPTLIADSSKLQSELNWSPRYDDLELIVRTTLDWIKKIRSI